MAIFPLKSKLKIRGKNCSYFSHSRHERRLLSCKTTHTKSLKFKPEVFINRGKSSGRFLTMIYHI